MTGVPLLLSRDLERPPDPSTSAGLDEECHDQSVACVGWRSRRKLARRYRARLHAYPRLQIGSTLLKLYTTRWPGTIQVLLQTLADHGEPWDDKRIEQLVQELADIGVNLDSDERRCPKAPLESLADEGRRRQFLALMERALDTLPGSP